MEYNTQRPKLKITDYGRHVAKMIEHCRTIADRDERTRTACNIVEVMAHVAPKVKERTDYKHVLWDHLMIMADNDLDVDCPYEVTNDQNATFHPNTVPYLTGNIRYRHYGRSMQNIIKAVADMPESVERRVLTEQIAHAMKRQYLQWNRDTVEDEVIVQQLDELSGGRLQLPQGFVFRDAQLYLDAMAAVQAKREASEAKKKKKKKKK